MARDRSTADGGPPDACLVLFTKPAVPGRVKTRLIGELTAEQAAELHAAFVEDALASLAGPGHELRVAWALAEGEQPPACRVPGFRQAGRDLGERLYRGLHRAAAGHRRVAAVGSDHPDLPVALVEEAFGRLESGGRVVLGPAADGGYYLIALRGEDLQRELFEGVAWSTPAVLEQTVARCRLLGLEPSLLAEWSDVDRPDDLARLTAALANGGPSCPRTRRLLAAWGRL